MASARSGSARLELVEREVPPVVHGEQVAGLPVRSIGREEANAVVDPALHLVGVHDGVDRPHVVGVGLDRREAGVECLP